MPVLGANVTLVASSSAVNNYTKDDETNHGDDFNQTEGEFHFSVSFNSEDVDEADQHQEDGDPHSDVD